MKTKRTIKRIFFIILILVVIAAPSVYGIMRFAVQKSFVLSIEEKNLLENAEFKYDGEYKAPDGWFSRRGFYWQKTQKNASAGFEVAWDGEVEFNAVYFEEKTDGVVLFRIYAKNGAENWSLIYEQDRIGAQNICYLESVRATAMRVEILETNSVIKLDKMAVYNLPKKDTKDFKVSQYLRMDGTDIIDLAGDSGFSGYYDVVTDVIIFETAYIDSNGALAFYGGEKEIDKYFDANIAALKTIIGGRGVRIWATVMFDQYNTAADGSRVKDLDKTTALLNTKREKVNESIKAFVEKYGLYGIDYDWEYPQKQSHWKAYGQIISDTAEYTKVSVAISPWHFDAPKETIDKVEHFNVMGYDLFDKRMHHSTTAEAAFAAIGNTINRLKIPREKILFGIPTYGRATNGSGNSWPFYGETVQLIDGEYVGSLGKWSNKIQTYTYTENGIEKSSAGYLNGYAIVRDKTLFALYAEIGGVMIFRAKCDASYDYEYSLHRAIKNTLDAFTIV